MIKREMEIRILDSFHSSNKGMNTCPNLPVKAFKGMSLAIDKKKKSKIVSIPSKNPFI